MKLNSKFFMVMFLTELIVFNAPLMAQGAEEAIALTLPGIQWVMKIEASGFALDQRGPRPDGHSAYFMASNSGTGVVLSGYIENRRKNGTPKDAMDYFWEETKKAPIKMKDLKRAESEQMVILEYVVPEHQGIPVNQKNIWAYLTRDQFWINLHLSKSDFRSSHMPSFKAILDSLSFQNKLPGKKVQTLYRVSELYTTSLAVPCGWQDEIRRQRGDLPPTIVFRPETMPASEIHVTPIWSPQGESGFNSSQNIRQILDEGGRSMLAQSSENKLTFREFNGKSGSGWYFTLTDRSPHIRPGEYKYMTQGGIGVGRLLVMFTIFTNEKNSDQIPAALEMASRAVQK